METKSQVWTYEIYSVQFNFIPSPDSRIRGIISQSYPLFKQSSFLDLRVLGDRVSI